MRTALLVTVAWLSAAGAAWLLILRLMVRNARSRRWR
jgi:hypothetical protein